MNKLSVRPLRTALVLVICLLLAVPASAVLILPSDTKVIEEEAFYGSTSIDEVVLPEGIEEIGERAFSESSLTKINLPASLTRIADVIFGPDVEVTVAEGTLAYEWAVAHGYIEVDTPEDEFVFDSATGMIQSYIGERTTVRIPAAISGVSVTRITSGAFSGNTTLTELVIPETVTDIGTYAFRNCLALEKVSGPIAWYVTSLNPAFDGCQVKEFRITGSPEEIPEYTFDNTEFSTLEKVVLPATVASIGTDAFSGCAALTVLTTAGNETENNVFPAGLTSIGNGAFRGCASLKEIKFPEGLQAIGSNAFNGCAGLTELVIPETVTDIGTYAFRNCAALESVSSPIAWYVTSLSPAFDGCQLKEFRITGSPEEIPEYAFDNTEFSTLEKIVLPETVTSIGANAFAGCTSLKEINFPEGMQVIGSNAFNGCAGLTELIIPQTVTSIGTYAFKDCISLRTVFAPLVWSVESTNPIFDGCQLKELHITGSVTEIPARAFINEEYITLEKVVLPETVTIIGVNAFAGCTALKEINFPEGLQAIGSNAFNGCAGLTELIIPQTVTSIGTYAFRDCINLRTVSAPLVWSIESTNPIFDGCQLKELHITGSVTEIPARAFINEEYITLEKVMLPETVTSIGANAFAGCSALKEINFPEGLQAIGSNAFNGCAGLTELVIPETVTSIGTYAFRGCTGLRTVFAPLVWSVESTNPVFDGCQLKELHITGSVTEIPARAFIKDEYMTLEKVVLPETVTSIGGNAFAGCTALKEINFPEGLQVIGNNAFNGCAGLTELIIPKTVTDIGVYAFRNCSALEKVTSPIAWYVTSLSPAFDGCQVKEFRITSSPEEIPEYAFDNAEFSTLEKVVLPATVTSIGTDAFSGCAALTVLTTAGNETENNVLPAGLTSIGNGAFRGCASLEEINFPEGFQAIGSNSFNGCTGLTELVIPETVTSIGTYAFRDCTGLRTVFAPLVWSVESTNPVFDGCQLKELHITGSVTEIPARAFIKDEYMTLEKVVLPETVTGIGVNAFAGCTALKEINFPEGLQVIGNNAFNGCAGLTELIIPKTVTDIGVYAFRNCSALEKVISPIAWYVMSLSPAFDGCQVKEFRITGSPVEIPEYAFDNAEFSTLEKVVLPATVSSIGTDAFSGCAALTVLTTTGNETEKNSFPAGLTNIGNGAFRGCASLEEINFPEGLQAIGSNAFNGCAGLTELIIPQTVTRIGTYAFRDCINLRTVSAPLVWSVESTNPVFDGCQLKELHITGSVTEIPARAFINEEYITLEKVVLPETVTSIGVNAFAGCTALKEINFPEGLLTIGSNAFNGCVGLTELVIPETVTSIGTYAFEGCVSITEIYCNPDSYAWTWFTDNSYADVLIEWIG